MAVKREGVYKDLMEISWFNRLVKWRGLQFTLQFALLAGFGVVLYAGLFGTPIGAENFASTMTWLLWWSLIPVTMLIAAKGWCLVCPWIAPGEWMQRLAFWWKGKRTFSLNLKFPRFLRNFWLMFLLFLLLHWANSSFHLALRPDTTVYIALLLFGLAIVISLVFEKRSFCRYVCPVGPIISAYAQVAPVELRNKDPEVCRTCKTRDCYNGNEKGYGCPMMVHPYDFNIDERGYAPCRVACPAGVNSEGYIALILKGKFREALNLHRKTTPLVGVLGRVCNHLCETYCEKAKIDGPVSIRGMKRFMADHELLVGRGKVTPIKKTKKDKVAIIGSGPAGLSCAYDLLMEGYPVTIFEAAPEAGGLLRYGIPEYRLPKEILDGEISYIEELGVQIKTDSPVKDLSDIFSQGYKAVFLGVGANKSPRLGIPGEDAEGVIHALDFLKRVNSGEKIELGQRVAVIGGGNAAIDAASVAQRLVGAAVNGGDETVIDAAAVAQRLGAKEVSIIYRRSRDEMPAISSEIEEAEREGVKFHLLASPVKILTQNGRITGVQCIKMELGEPDDSGRRRPIPIKGSEFDIAVDSLIVAIGQAVDKSTLPREIKYTDWDTVSVDPITRQTNIDGVFAGGDVVAGPANVIGVIADGKETAISIDRYLKGLDLKEGRPPPIRQPEEAATSMKGIEIKSRDVMPVLALEKRDGFSEVELGFSKKMAATEADRCWTCGVSPEGSIDRNTYCVMCTECAKTCPNDNVAINIRRPFHDIFKKGLGFFRTKEISFSLSVIAIVLLGVVPFHSLEMTAAYVTLEESVMESLGVSQMVVGTSAFLLIGAVAVAIFWLVSAFTRRRAGDSPYSTKHIFIWFALAFIPLAISLHIAHNYFHLLQEGAAIIPTLSDPFGFGWNLFGTAGASVTIVSADVITLLQFLTVGFGFLASGYALYRLPLNLFKERGQALRTMAPMAVFLIGLVVFYGWVLTIPMTMRF